MRQLFNHQLELHIALAGIVCVLHSGGILINYEGIAVGSASVPAARPGHIKVTRKSGEIKGSVDAYADRILIIIAVYRTNVRLAQVQTCQQIIGTGKALKLGVLAHIKHCQLVFAAIQAHKLGIAAYVQRRQSIAAAIQAAQLSRIAHIQFCQMIIAAIESDNLPSTHIQSSQSIGITVQMRYCGILA